MEVEDRKKAEAEFHNTREEMRKADPDQAEAHYNNRRFYRTADRSRHYLERIYAEHCPEKKVLDYCCGTGGTTLQLAELGADVVGIDISDVSIESGRRKAAERNLQERAHFYVMDAENTEFEDDSFDVIFCHGVLHHVDLQAAYRELARLLKPDGLVVCMEALVNNPIIQLYRRRTPHLRTAWEVEHILSVRDIHGARDCFEKVDIKFFHLASLVAIPFIGRPGFRFLLSILNVIDDIILHIPLIRNQAWMAIFTLSGPKH